MIQGLHRQVRITATGGDVEYTLGTNKIHVFTSPGTLSNPSDNVQIVLQKHVLIAGGGGSQDTFAVAALEVLSSLSRHYACEQNSFDHECWTECNGNYWCWRTSRWCRTTKSRIQWKAIGGIILSIPVLQEPALELGGGGGYGIQHWTL